MLTGTADSLRLVLIYLLYVLKFLPAYMSLYHICVMPAEASRGCQNSSSTWFWPTMWVLGIEAESSGRTASVLTWWGWNQSQLHFCLNKTYFGPLFIFKCICNVHLCTVVCSPEDAMVSSVYLHFISLELSDLSSPSLFALVSLLSIPRALWLRLGHSAPVRLLIWVPVSEPQSSCWWSRCLLHWAMSPNGTSVVCEVEWFPVPGQVVSSHL